MFEISDNLSFKKISNHQIKFVTYIFHLTEPEKLR